MQDAERQEQESHSTNQFNDAEYERLSEKLRALKSAEPDWGFESFLCQTKNP
jgi:hypothetical protein